MRARRLRGPASSLLSPAFQPPLWEADQRRCLAGCFCFRWHCSFGESPDLKQITNNKLRTAKCGPKHRSHADSHRACRQMTGKDIAQRARTTVPLAAALLTDYDGLEKVPRTFALQPNIGAICSRYIATEIFQEYVRAVEV